MNASWIQRHLVLLRIIEAVSGIVIVGMVVTFALAARQQPVTLSRSQAGLLFSPWLVFFGVFCILLYHRWFVASASPNAAVRTALRLAYWTFAAACLVVFGGTYGHFVLRLF